jgi:hypothetical protein
MRRMMDRNNLQVVALIQQWLAKQGDLPLRKTSTNPPRARCGANLFIRADV